MEKSRESVDVKHHFSQSEHKSYVEYINQVLSNSEGLNLPIDKESPTHLFEVVSQGVLLAYANNVISVMNCRKLINVCFPGTIDEKKLVTKPEKSKFEININLDATIEGAKAIGMRISST
jgi:hypothetical protein